MKTLRRNARKEIRSFGVRVLGISQEQNFTDMFKETLKKINLEDYIKDFKRREAYRLSKKIKSIYNEEFKKTFEEALKIIKNYKKIK